MCHIYPFLDKQSLEFQFLLGLNCFPSPSTQLILLISRTSERDLISLQIYSQGEVILEVGWTLIQ